MSKARAGTFAALILTALAILNTVLILKGQDENNKRANETRAIAVNNCRNIGTLAKVERAFITRQETQTQALLASGVTFGIPKEQLPKLIDASRKSQALFLRELDSLTVANCTAGGSLSTPVVKPHKAKAAKPKTGSVAVPRPSAPAGVGTTSPGKTSPRTLAEHRRTGPRSASPAPVTQSASPNTQAPTAAPSAPSTGTTARNPPTPAPATTSPAPPPLLPVLPVPCVKTGVLTVC